MVDVLVAEKYASLAPFGWILAALLVVLAVIFWRKERNRTNQVITAVMGISAIASLAFTWTLGVSWYPMDNVVEQDIIKAVSDEYKMSFSGVDSTQDGLVYYYITEGGKMTSCLFDISSITDEGIQIVTESRGERTFPVKVVCAE